MRLADVHLRMLCAQPGMADDCTDRSVQIWEVLGPLASASHMGARRSLMMQRSPSTQGLDYVEC